jgi:ADP-ribosylglycohydrolase
MRMLSNHPWIKLQKDLKFEWRQLCDEGYVVESFKDRCAAISSSAEDREAEAVALAKEMKSMPIKADYPYCEPSDLESINKKASHRMPVFREITDTETLKDKIAGAWTGRVFGCLLGKPVEGMRRDKLLPMLKGTDNYPMRKYIEQKEFGDELVQTHGINLERCWRDKVDAIVPVDDDTNYTVFSLKLIETYGFGFTDEDVMEGWLRWIPMLAVCTAERAAYRNAATGLLPPETALHNNPYREWIGAQIRTDFYGYVSPGDPVKAAEFAFRDASISHVKNGIYGAMWVAAMTAAAAVCDSIPDIISAGLSVIPINCRLANDVNEVLDWHANGVSAAEAIERTHKKYDEHDGHDWCHACSNAMVVALGLLYGGGEFGPSICLAVEAAFDTDCNGSTVGSIVGMLRGRGGIDENWAFADMLATSIDGFNLVKISELVEKTMKLIAL